MSSAEKSSLARGQNITLSVITQLKDQDYRTVFLLKYKKAEPVYPMTPWTNAIYLKPGVIGGRVPASLGRFYSE